MKALLNKSLLVVALLLFLGCAKNYEYLDTVKKVDIEKYQGKWYEIARFDHFFERDCKNVTATYELKNDEEIKVINRCTKIKTNEKKEAIGIAYAKDETNSKLKVSFFRPFYGDYWIVHLDKDYKHVLVGTPSREYLWILSREKTISENIKKELVKKASKEGFDTSKFIWTIQE